MSDLLLEIETVTDMDLERAVAVGRAFDADPAPHNHEESVPVRSDLGPIEIRWFIDDSGTADIYLFGALDAPCAHRPSARAMGRRLNGES